jgi:hypothetical protein
LSNKDLFQNQNRRESLLPLSPRPIELNRHTVFHEMRNDGCSLPWGVFRSKILQKSYKGQKLDVKLYIFLCLQAFSWMAHFAF